MTRKPAAFRLDDPQVIVADDETRAARGTVRVVPQPEDFDLRPPGKTFMAEYAKFIASRNELLGSADQLSAARQHAVAG